MTVWGELRLIAAEALMRLGCWLTPNTEEGLILLAFMSGQITKVMEERVKCEK